MGVKTLRHRRRRSATRNSKEGFESSVKGSVSEDGAALVRYGEGTGPRMRHRMEDVLGHKVKRAVERATFEGSP